MATHAGRLPQAPAQTATKVGGVADRKARRAFRTRRILPSLLAAVLLTAAGTVIAIEVISKLVNRPAHIVDYERMTSWFTGIAWNSWQALAISAGVAVVGLFFLLAGVLPGGTRLVPLHGDDPDLLIGVTKHGLKGSVTGAAEMVDGVTGVRHVKVAKRKVIVTVDTEMRVAEGLDRQVQTAVQRRLDELGPVPARTAVARVHLRKD